MSGLETGLSGLTLPAYKETGALESAPNNPAIKGQVLNICNKKSRSGGDCCALYIAGGQSEPQIALRR